MQDLDEGFAELDVERGVDDGVDGAVQVSEPGDGAVQRPRDAAAPAVRLQHMREEERQPADDEHTLETRRGRIYSTYILEGQLDVMKTDSSTV